MGSPLRRWFVDDVEAEVPLGTHTRGLYWLTQRALVARIDGRRELVIERSSGIRKLGSGGLHYIHVPSDGLENLRMVATRLMEGDMGPPPGFPERFSRAVLRAAALPFMLLFLSFPLFIIALMATEGSGTQPEAVVNPLWLFAGFGAAIFGVMALQYGSLWVVATLRGMSVDAAEALRRFGPVRHASSLGTYRGALGKGGWDQRLRPATMHVMASESGPGWLLLTRLSSGGIAWGVGVYELPAEGVPALLALVEGWED